MRVFLIGYMGSGKTTLGKKIAQKLNLKFIDSDKFIEESEQSTIPLIFNNNGEEKFREIESNAIKKITEQDNVIVSTGGGTPCFQNNLELLMLKGTVVYLQMKPAFLADRLINSKQNRPLILGKGKEELLQFIENHIKEREPFYQQAHFTIDAANLNAQKIDELCDKIATFKMD